MSPRVLSQVTGRARRSRRHRAGQAQLQRQLTFQGNLDQHNNQQPLQPGSREIENNIQPPIFSSCTNVLSANTSTMIEKSDRVNNILQGKTVLDHLAPFSIPIAAMEIHSRSPRPSARRRISAKLEAWLVDKKRHSNLLWLYGPASVGKSAVAQNFAMHCAERKRLGAVFFFSGYKNRDNPRRIIPTLAYQLATQCDGYNKSLAHQLVDNPLVPNAAMHVQFRQLLVEPLSRLPRVQHPYLIILDGLDECQGEYAQLEIIELIGDIIGRKDLPLLWLICSRPEPHIKYMFARADFTIKSDREELLIDAKSRRQVSRYLQVGLKNIQAKLSDSMAGTWPSEDQLSELVGATSGSFIFASTALRYIDDPVTANPPARLNALLSFIKHSHSIGANSPLEVLDLLYTWILSDIPDGIFPMTRRILSYYLYLPDLYRYGSAWPPSAQILCNFLSLDQNTFYSALQKLHSIVNVPPPEAATTTPLRCYHTSFGDYLRDPVRSGKFALEERMTLVDIAKSCLYWHEIDSTTYHTHDGLGFFRVHRHAALPELKWPSYSCTERISRDIARFAERHCWAACVRTYDAKDRGLLLTVCRFDFRYIDYDGCNLLEFANWLHNQVSDGPNNNIIRTKPCNDVDQKLVNYLKLMINPEPIKSVTFPLKWVR